MVKADKGGVERSILAQAAAGLELELRRFDELAATVNKIPLDSEKNLERAGKPLSEVADSEQRVTANVRALLEAMHAERDRKEASEAPHRRRAAEIEARVKDFSGLLERLSALGSEAAEINGLVQELAAAMKEAAGDKRGALTRIEEVQSRMGQAVENAQSLQNAAKEKDVVDIAQQADSIRQQIAAARNRLKLLAEKMAEKSS